MRVVYIVDGSGDVGVWRVDDSVVLDKEAENEKYIGVEAYGIGYLAIRHWGTGKHIFIPKEIAESNMRDVEDMELCLMTPHERQYSRELIKRDLATEEEGVLRLNKSPHLLVKEKEYIGVICSDNKLKRFLSDGYEERFPIDRRVEWKVI